MKQYLLMERFLNIVQCSDSMHNIAKLSDEALGMTEEAFLAKYHRPEHAYVMAYQVLTGNPVKSATSLHDGVDFDQSTTIVMELANGDKELMTSTGSPTSWMYEMLYQQVVGFIELAATANVGDTEVSKPSSLWCQESDLDLAQVMTSNKRFHILGVLDINQLIMRVGVGTFYQTAYRFELLPEVMDEVILKVLSYAWDSLLGIIFDILLEDMRPFRQYEVVKVIAEYLGSSAVLELDGYWVFLSEGPHRIIPEIPGSLFSPAIVTP